jgi:hypothetical protein
MERKLVQSTSDRVLEGGSSIAQGKMLAGMHGNHRVASRDEGPFRILPHRSDDCSYFGIKPERVGVCHCLGGQVLSQGLAVMLAAVLRYDNRSLAMPLHVLLPGRAGQTVTHTEMCASGQLEPISKTDRSRGLSCPGPWADASTTIKDKSCIEDDCFLVKKEIMMSWSVPE